MRSSRTFHSGIPRQNLTAGSVPRKIAAGVALTGLAFGLISASPAMAAVGGGGVGGGAGGTGGAADSYALYALDNDLDPATPGIQPEQGWGDSSINYFASAMESEGGWANTTDSNDSMDGTRRGINTACQAAIAQAISRASGPGPHQARVVMVGANYSIFNGEPKFGWGDLGGHDRMQSWFNGQTAANAWQPDLVGYTAADYAEIADVFKANIRTDPQLVCVALNEQEPSIYRQYTLEITTDAKDAFTIANGAAPVFDTIHASNGGSSIVENVNADVILNWTGEDGSTKQVVKSKGIANNGDTVSDGFVPADFGWASWEGGSYWFDVHVAKQGQMAAAVDTPDNDPRESWDAWKPEPNKDVIGSGEESGDHTHDSINGLSVWPGQKLEYSVGLDLVIPEKVRDKITSFAVQDSFDAQFTPDKTSVEFWDSRNPANPKPVAKSAYKLTWDAAKNSFTATFTDAWVKDNLVGNTAQGWLTMRFTGTVKDTAAPGSTVKNQAFEVINDVKIATEVPVVEIPSIQPDKEDLNTDLIDIDGKTVVEGDTILYRLTMDATPGRAELAYNVHKLGMVDDFDEEYLKVDTADIRITNRETGADVTAQFNIQVIDGIAYMFAKTVDTTLPTGETVAGDPQPSNLKDYDAAAINPLTDPIINQDLLGAHYWVTMPAKVIKEKDGYVIENQARENLENSHKQTKIVSNPLKDIDPNKDVVVSPATGDDSIDGSEVTLNSVFNYRLNSSEIPANRAYDASSWSLRDTFDRVHDAYTGIWAVHAGADLYDGTTRVAKKGDLLADSSGFALMGHDVLFSVAFDEASYTLKATATQAFLDLVNTRGDLAQSFSVYSKMTRIAPADKVDNVTIETYNDVDRESNVVWTKTPENPAIDVEKYTLSEGLTKGDRDKSDQAYSIPKKELTAGTRVGIRVTNTGDVPLKNVTLTDATHKGLAGTVTDITCAAGSVDPKAIGDLAVGASIDCEGTLTGVQDGQLHGDTATATGESVYTGKKVTDEDPWFATAPGSLAQTGGAVNGTGLLVGGSMLALAAAAFLLAKIRRRDRETSTMATEAADS